MDNLTHALTGAALSRAGLERATPLATATLVLAANAPDVDILAYVKGPYFALAFRRGLTHGLPAAGVLAVAVAGAVLAWDRLVRRRRRPDARPARFGPLLALSVVGLATHPALDWMNTYGMRWWMPLDGGWSYGDALFIVDPWLWLLLGGAAFLGRSWSGRGLVGWGMLCAATSALVLLGPVAAGGKAAWAAGVAALVVGSAARARSGARSGRPAARALTAAAAVYVLAMIASDASASRLVREEAAARGLDVVDVMVAPSPAAPLSAEVEVVTPDGYVPGAFRWLGRPPVSLREGEFVPHLVVDPAPGGAGGARPGQAESPPPEMGTGGRARPGALVERVVARAREVPDARAWLVWSRYPYVRVTPDGDGWTVRFADARYDGGAGSGSLAGVTVRVEASDLPR